MLSATFQVGWQNGTYFRGICGEVFYSLRTKEAKLWPFFHWISLFITDKLNVCGIWKIQRLSMSSQTTEAIKLMLPFRQQKYLLCGAWAISWSSSPKGERDCVTYTLLSSPIHRLAAKTLVRDSQMIVIISFGGNVFHTKRYGMRGCQLQTTQLNKRLLQKLNVLYLP